MKKWIKRAAIVLGCLVLLALGAGLIAHESRPSTGETGPAADALARRVLEATGDAHWQSQQAVRWTFAGRHEHLWDRRRGYVRTTYGSVEALMRMDGSGIATKDGVRSAEALHEAFGRFINDSFWLHPFGKAFDPGVTRSVLQREGKDVLFIEFSSGGRTPGDAYAIETDASGLPTRWQMWVQVLPIGGLGCTWAGWETLDGGARVSTLHATSLVDLRLSDVRAGTLESLTGGEDPFAELH
ncbi:MAG: hypothetical protein AAF938_18140 [Myxococcota bacterium]